MPDPVCTMTTLVVIQATPFCNVNCRYCYLPNRSSTKRIDNRTLKRIFACLFTEPRLSDPVSIVWHAGEPLVLPISFYENAFRIAEQCNTRGIRIVHSFQTNGTLINQDWCDFLKQYNVKIGVSLDGPRHIHDRSAPRPTRATEPLTARCVASNCCSKIIFTLRSSQYSPISSRLPRRDLAIFRRAPTDAPGFQRRRN